MEHTRLPYPSLSPGVCSKSCPLSWWSHPTISSSVVPFSSCLQSFPASVSFSMSHFFTSGCQITGASVSASLVAQRLKHLPAMWETQVRSLGQEDPLEKEIATHSSILAWRITWTEEADGLQSMGSQRVRHDWVTSLSLSVSASFLPMNIQDWFPYGWTGLISLQSKRLSRVFSNTTAQ